ncbi:PREDICTED: uncharacterized protein LOC106805240 isoform X2 [Priapulus caudatus]|uniref:Protection of telomeres protein 1 n=1 Tax=Priapulus caudatus TaxID=37621 RepID=A0ABM1DQM9_PRICU|nr:PREDICTED: uncharacterized protein LOC106805240 isoform X2 [Priapulus caudatus]
MEIVRVVVKSAADITEYIINGVGSETLEQLIPKGALHTTIKDLKRSLSKRYIKGKISWKGSLTSSVGENRISLKITDDKVCKTQKQQSPQTARGSRGKVPKDMVVLIDFSGNVAVWVDRVTQLWDTVVVCHAMTRQCEHHQDMGVNQWKLDFVPAVSSRPRPDCYFFVDTRHKWLTGNAATMDLKVMETPTPMEASTPQESTSANNSNTTIASGASCTGGRFQKRKLDFSSIGQSKSKGHEQTGGTVFTKPAKEDDERNKIRGSTAIQKILATLPISQNLGERNSVPSGEISISQQEGTNTNQTVGTVTPDILKSSFWEDSKDLSDNVMAIRDLSDSLEVNRDLSEVMPNRVESALRESSVSSRVSTITEQSSNPIWLIGSPPVMDVTAGVMSEKKRCNNTTLIKDLAVGSIASVWGIVKFLNEPRRTRGSDWLLHFGLVDRSTGEEDGDAVHCHMFAPLKQLLPQINRIGDIMLLLHAKVNLFNGKLQLGSTAATVALVFDEDPASSEQPRTGSADLLYSFIELDRKRLRHYRELFKSTKSFSSVTTKKSLISDIKLNSYSDVYCQIVTVNAVHPDTLTMLNVWDGTALNRSLRVRRSAEEQARLTCESLQVALPVCVTGSQAAIASKLQVGDHVWLRNLHCLRAPEVHQDIASGFTVVHLLMACGSTIDREMVPLARISQEVQSLNISLMNLHDELEPVIASHPCGPLQESFNAEARVEREMSSTHQAEHGDKSAAATPSRSLLVTCQVTSVCEIPEKDMGYTRITGSSDRVRRIDEVSDVGVTHPPFRDVCGDPPITLHLMPCDTAKVQQLKVGQRIQITGGVCAEAADVSERSPLMMDLSCEGSITARELLAVAEGNWTSESLQRSLADAIPSTAPSAGSCEVPGSTTQLLSSAAMNATSDGSAPTVDGKSIYSQLPNVTCGQVTSVTHERSPLRRMLPSTSIPPSHHSAGNSLVAQTATPSGNDMLQPAICITDVEGRQANASADPEMHGLSKHVGELIDCAIEISETTHHGAGKDAQIHSNMETLNVPYVLRSRKRSLPSQASDSHATQNVAASPNRKKSKQSESSTEELASAMRKSLDQTRFSRPEQIAGSPNSEKTEHPETSGVPLGSKILRTPVRTSARLSAKRDMLSKSPQVAQEEDQGRSMEVQVTLQACTSSKLPHIAGSPSSKKSGQSQAGGTLLETSVPVSHVRTSRRLDAKRELLFKSSQMVQKEKKSQSAKLAEESQASTSSSEQDLPESCTNSTRELGENTNERLGGIGLVSPVKLFLHRYTTTKYTSNSKQVDSQDRPGSLLKGRWPALDGHADNMSMLVLDPEIQVRLQQCGISHLLEAEPGVYRVTAKVTDCKPSVKDARHAYQIINLVCPVCEYMEAVPQPRYMKTGVERNKPNNSGKEWWEQVAPSRVTDCCEYWRCPACILCMQEQTQRYSLRKIPEMVFVFCLYLTLQDDTGTLDVLLFSDDAVNFFNGVAPLDLMSDEARLLPMLHSIFERLQAQSEDGEQVLLDAAVWKRPGGGELFLYQIISSKDNIADAVQGKTNAA